MSPLIFALLLLSAQINALKIDESRTLHLDDGSKHDNILIFHS